MNLIKNLQEKPEKERKTILWVILGIIAIIFIVLWLNISLHRFGGLREMKIEDVSSKEELPIKEDENVEEILQELNE